MGHGIAQVSAMAGHDVHIRDIETELVDVVGLDVRLDILEYLREELGERFRPPQVLKRKVRAGHLGRKSGRGFYVWEDGEAVRPVDGE